MNGPEFDPDFNKDEEGADLGGLMSQLKKKKKDLYEYNEPTKGGAIAALWEALALKKAAEEEAAMIER